MARPPLTKSEFKLRLKEKYSGKVSYVKGYISMYQKTKATFECSEHGRFKMLPCKIARGKDGMPLLFAANFLKIGLILLMLLLKLSLKQKVSISNLEGRDGESITLVLISPFYLVLEKS